MWRAGRVRHRRQWGSRIYLNEEATLRRLRKSGVSASILHIATHGRFRRDNPWFSAIRFGDGYLNLYDLYELRIASRLVVLSGCSTGSSVVLGGDESVGLARGLLHAGATSAVLSLWDVNDASTAMFMEKFYSGLAAGIESQAALQAAQSAVRASHPHPFYWAPFVLTGRYGGIASEC
jgi:CHAT domain-containing protein